MRDALLFDLDGTLTDPRQGIERCIRHGMEVVGYPLGAEVDLRPCIGPPLLESLQGLLGPPRAHLAPLALAAYRERYATRGMLDNKVYPGIHEALAQLAQGYDLYVATSKPTVFAMSILDNFGLNGHFKAIHGSELDGTRSDKAELIGYILTQQGLSPARTRMVGDRRHDMVGALHNGLDGIGVLWGYGQRQELLDAGASRLLTHPTELVDL